MDAQKIRDIQILTPRDCAGKGHQAYPQGVEAMRQAVLELLEPKTADEVKLATEAMDRKLGSPAPLPVSEDLD